MKPISTRLCPAGPARSFKFVDDPPKGVQSCLWYVFMSLLMVGILYLTQTLANVQLETTPIIRCAMLATLFSFVLDMVVGQTTFESTFHNVMLWVVIYTILLIGRMNKDQRKFVESQCACSNATEST